MLPIKNILLTSLKRAGILSRVSAVAITAEAEQVLTEVLGLGKQHCKALYVKNTILTIASLRPAVSDEIRFREAEILLKLNGKIDSPGIEKIRLID